MVITDEVARLRHVAGVLLPGDERSPAAASVDDLDELLTRAIEAIGTERPALRSALALLPERPDWESLRSLATTHPAEFEVVSAVAAGAYFMSPAVLDTIGYTPGDRRAARPEQVVDELEGGVLDPVLARDGLLRAVTP